jgi:hypothetical protein
LSPIAAITVAAAGLALIYELENNHLGFRHHEFTTVSPGEAVDISLQRLMRPHVVIRLQRANRLNSSVQRNRETITTELGRIQKFPLFVIIKERMTDHLRNEGYGPVAIHSMKGMKDPMLSMKPEMTLHEFILGVSWVSDLVISFLPCCRASSWPIMYSAIN